MEKMKEQKENTEGRDMREFYIKKNGEGEYVVTDTDSDGGLLTFIITIFIAIIIGYVYLIYKCMFLCEQKGKSKILALVPGYNLYLISEYACGSGWALIFYLGSFFSFVLMGVMGFEIPGMLLMIAFQASAMFLNYKFYNYIGLWETKQKILTFVPTLTAFVALYNIAKSIKEV